MSRKHHVKKTVTSTKSVPPIKFKANNVLHYTISSYSTTADRRGPLIDRGANGSMIGNDMRVIAKTDWSVDVCGIDNHELSGLRIVTAGGVVESNKGNIIVIVHQAAHVPNGKTIVSSPQAEHFGTIVKDHSRKVHEGGQSITTLDGYIIPLSFVNRLPYMSIQPFTNAECNELVHVVLTSDTE